MKKALALGVLICAIASIGTGSPSAASRASKFAPHQEPRYREPRRIEAITWRSSTHAGVKSATGSVYVRNDPRRQFVRLQLRPESAGLTFDASTRARPPHLVGNRLFCHSRSWAIAKTRRTARVPARGTSSRH